MTDFMGQLIRTGDTALAVDFVLGVSLYVIAFSAVWFSLTTNTRDYFPAGGAGAVVLYMVHHDIFIVCGKVLRGFFLGSLPAIGWLSFFVLLILAGAVVGIAFAHKYRVTQRGEESAQRIEGAAPQYRVTEVAVDVLPKRQSAPARLTRTHTPPAVPVEFRREKVPAIPDRRR